MNIKPYCLFILEKQFIESFPINESTSLQQRYIKRIINENTIDGLNHLILELDNLPLNEKINFKGGWDKIKNFAQDKLKQLKDLWGKGKVFVTNLFKKRKKSDPIIVTKKEVSAELKKIPKEFNEIKDITVAFIETSINGLYQNNLKNKKDIDLLIKGIFSLEKIKEVSKSTVITSIYYQVMAICSKLIKKDKQIIIIESKLQKWIKTNEDKLIKFKKKSLIKDAIVSYKDNLISLVLDMLKFVEKEFLSNIKEVKTKKSNIKLSKQIEEAIKEKDLILVRSSVTTFINEDCRLEKPQVSEYAKHVESELKKEGVELFVEDDKETEFPEKNKWNKKLWTSLKVDIGHNFSREKFQLIQDIMHQLRHGHPDFQVK